MEREKSSNLQIEVWEAVTLFLLVGVGLWLRIRHLGDLSLYADEDLTTLAVGGILEDGYPHMPSGMGYWRAPLYSYVVAFSVYWFGLNEWAIRLPSVLFGTATLPLLYLLGRFWIGRYPALLAAALLTFSTLHIIFSRMGRMYVMFLFFLILTVYYLVHSLVENKPSYRYISFVLALVTVTLHGLGIIVAILFFIPIFLRSCHWRIKVIFSGIGVSLMIFAAFLQKFQNVTFVKGAEAAVTGGEQGIIVSLFGLFRHLKFYPKFRIAAHLFENAPMFYALIALILLSVIFFYFRKGSTQGEIILLIGVLSLSLLNLYGVLGIGILIAGYFLAPIDWKGIDRRLWGTALIFTGGLLLFWWVYGITVWRGEGFVSLSQVGLIRKVVKESIYFPAMHIIVFFRAFPIMTMIMVLGTGLWLYRHCIGRYDNLKALLILAFWVPLLTLGLTREWVAMRYLFPLYPFYILIYADTAGIVFSKAISYLKIKRTNWAWPVLIFLLIGIPIFAEYHGFKRAFAVTRADQSYRVSTYVNSSFPLFPDHKGAGRFVRESLKKDDIVVAMDATAQLYYIGKVDYWLRAWSDAKSYAFQSDERHMDIYTGAEIISDYQRFKEIVCPRQGGVWLITSAEVIEYRNQFVPQEVWAYLDAHSKDRLWTGQDGITEVYYFKSRNCITP